jgi:CheY-like chemotaxis protein
MEPDRQPISKAVILIVEDEALLRLMLSDQLRDDGFTVIEAADSEEALRYIAAGGPADLVFSDVHMPGPVDGVGLARLLRLARPSLPIVLTSGLAEPGTLMEFGTFVAKPYQYEKVIVLIRELLKRTGDASKGYSHRRK